ncbi:MAG: TetR/AcrR family transcriptional regulator [Marinobacterium sp.]|nr:TetR/AcrR family transcriptional regulator [Marinobacterium sp.]
MSERKQREFERREMDILQAALMLLTHEHWEKITVAQIACQADIGKGTVYKHFPSKEAIYARLVLDDSEQLLQQLQQRAQQFDDPIELFRDLLWFSFRWCGKKQVPASLQIAIRQRSFRERLPEIQQQQIQQIEHQFFALIASHAEQGMKQGIFVKHPVEQLFTGLHATFDGAMMMIRNQDYLHSPSAAGISMNEEVFIAQMVEFMLSAMTGVSSDVRPTPHRDTAPG